MRLVNSREKLKANVRFWRGNLERGLTQGHAKAGETERLRKLIADLVLVELALADPWRSEVECEYKFPEASRLVRSGGKRKRALWMPPQ